VAVTYIKQGLRAYLPDDSYLSFAERSYPEGASQTYPIGSPLKNSSGNLVVWVSPTDGDIVAFALKAGQNASAGTKQVPVILALPEVLLEASFLGAAAADNAIAAADLWLARDLEYDADFVQPGSAAGWYIEDAADDAALTIVGFAAGTVNETMQSTAAVGDSNARVMAHVNPGVSLWY
jgi:hypothetical protein